MAATISYAEALFKIENSGSQPFRLTFVKSTGKDRGDEREAIAYYGAPNPRDRQAGLATPPDPHRKIRKTHRESGTIPLTEAGTHRLLTPRRDHLTALNGQKIMR